MARKRARRVRVRGRAGRKVWCQSKIGLPFKMPVGWEPPAEEKAAGVIIVSSSIRDYLF